MPKPKSSTAVLAFWFEESKPEQWYKKDAAFDDAIRDGFEITVTAALASADDTCSAAASAAARVHTARTTAHDSFTLTYFDGRGLAEVPRTSRSTCWYTGRVGVRLAVFARFLLFFS